MSTQTFTCVSWKPRNKMQLRTWKDDSYPSPWTRISLHHCPSEMPLKDKTQWSDVLGLFGSLRNVTQSQVLSQPQVSRQKKTTFLNPGCVGGIHSVNQNALNRWHLNFSRPTTERIFQQKWKSIMQFARTPWPSAKVLTLSWCLGLYGQFQSVRFVTTRLCAHS